MATSVAHDKWWRIFEVIVGVPLLLATALQLAVPLSFPAGLLAPARVPAGVVLIGAGVAIVFGARRELARRGQPTDPGHSTTDIVTTGVFSFSRNPLYLGGFCVIAGGALAFDLPWVLLLIVPAIVACHYMLVAPEEAYLASRFGVQYAHYTASVHRWLGRARRGP